MPFPRSMTVPGPSSIEREPTGRVRGRPERDGDGEHGKRGERETHACTQYRDGAWVDG